MSRWGASANAKRLIGMGESDANARFNMPITGTWRGHVGTARTLTWFEIVKTAEGTKPPILRELEVLDRDPTATLLRQKE